MPSAELGLLELAKKHALVEWERWGIRSYV